MIELIEQERGENVIRFEPVVYTARTSKHHSSDT